MKIIILGAGQEVVAEHWRKTVGENSDITVVDTQRRTILQFAE